MLFTDLVGSTELLSRLGELPAEQLRRTHFRLLRDAVRACGGREVKSTGDGLMVVFTSATDAVACAVAIQQGVDRQNRREEGEPLSLRIGVNAGDVIEDDQDYYGTTVNVASRLCAAAEGGQILVSDIVPGLVGPRSDYSFGSMGSLTLRGLPDPVPTSEVLWSRFHEQPPPLPPLLAATDPTPFVGRQEELDRLIELFEDALQARQQVVLVAGESGVGKTRLAHEFCRAVHERGAAVLHGRSYEESLVPYQSFVEALRQYVMDSPLDELRLQVARVGSELRRLVPEITARLEDIAPEQQDDDHEGERYRLFEAVAQLLADVSDYRPLVLVLEDLHWADKPTLMLLQHVLSARRDARLMVVATYRDAEVRPADVLAEAMASLRRDGLLTRLPLTGLGQESVDRLIEALAGRASPPQLSRTIGEETEGNPFFVAEMVRHLADSGVLDRETGWSAEVDLAAIGIPEDVRYVIERRLSHLSGSASRMLTIAAVVGREFDEGILGRLSGVGGDALLELLEEAVTARVVTEVPGAVGRYSFAHALIRETLYANMTAARRLHLHGRTADTLHEQYAGDASRAAEMAHHYLAAASLGGDSERAVQYACAAAEEAVDDLAPDEAARWYSRALTLVAGDPDRQAEKCELLIRLGDAQRQAGDPAFRETLLEASSIAERMDDPGRLVRAVLANSRGFVSATGVVDEERVEALEKALAAAGDGNHTARAGVLARLAAELTFSGDWERRRALSDEALEVARRTGDEQTLSDVLSTRFITIWTPETLPERLADTEEELDLADRSGDMLPRFHACHWRAVACVEAGQVEEARLLLGTERELAARLRQPVVRWIAAYDAATEAMLQGRLDRAEAHATEASAIGELSGQPEAQAFLAGQLLAIRFDQGRLGELAPLMADQVGANPGIPGFRAALALAHCEARELDRARELLAADAAGGFAELPYDSNWLVSIGLYAEACWQARDAEVAATLLPLLEPWREQVIFNSCLGFGCAARLVGVMLALLGRFDEACGRLGLAAEVHERIGAPIWLARTWLDLADVHDMRGDPLPPSLDLRRRALETARELGAAGLQRRAAEVAEGYARSQA